MALSEEEKQELISQIREELETEHARRLDNLTERKNHARERSHTLKERHRIAEASVLREKLWEEFCKEHHYRRYVDSTGRESWLPPEEYEWRMRRRGSRKHSPRFDWSDSGRRQKLLLYGGVALLAFVLGLFLAIKQL